MSTVFANLCSIIAAWTQLNPAVIVDQNVTVNKNVHTWYITASLFHWNIKVYIFITILERKDQVKKRTCGLGCSSFFTVRRKRKRSRLKNRKATVTGCHRFVHIWGREANSRTWIHTHLHPHTSAHRSIISPTFLKPCSQLYPLTRCKKSTGIISWTWSSGFSIFMACFVTSMDVSRRCCCGAKSANKR